MCGNGGQLYKTACCCRPGQGSTNHAKQMCHYAAAGMAFRDWPVDQEQLADALSGIHHDRPIQAFLVSLPAQIATCPVCCMRNPCLSALKTFQDSAYARRFCPPVHRVAMRTGIAHSQHLESKLMMECASWSKPGYVMQVGMNVSANEEPHRQHCGFYTFGLFTSRQRALACIQTREMSPGALSILPVSINAPLSPCLSTDLLSAHETRLMVRTCPIMGPANAVSTSERSVRAQDSCCYLNHSNHTASKCIGRRF